MTKKELKEVACRLATGHYFYFNKPKTGGLIRVCNNCDRREINRNSLLGGTPDWQPMDVEFELDIK